jgi:hypothetical protein
MIVKNMSDKEIVKELQSIEGVLKSRISGYVAKYRKKLKNKAYKHNDVLGVGEYVINGNKVLVCFQKLVFTDKLSDLGICNIVVTDGNGAFLPFTNEWGRFSYHHITNHAIDRMWQRMRLTIKDFFKNEYAINTGTNIHITKYNEYGNDDTTYIMAIGRCFCIVYRGDNKIVVKTVLDRDRIHPNQLKLYVNSKREAEEFADKMFEKNIGILNRMRVRKTSDLVRAMCA